jgi:hypothetical protein
MADCSWGRHQDPIANGQPFFAISGEALAGYEAPEERVLGIAMPDSLATSWHEVQM